MCLIIRILVVLLSAVSMGLPASGQIPLEPETEPSPSTTPIKQLKVLILGDSLSLCGFGKRLDTAFRQDPEVAAVFTYMVCGTIPVSWLSQGVFAHAKTFCGYWSIESIEGVAKPKEFLDGYDMGRHHVPKPYPVPKLDSLMSKIQPDIMVMQTGTNLLSLFRDGKTVRPEVQGPVLRKLIQPFLEAASAPSSSLKRIYWIASPTSGRVAANVQEFLFNQLQEMTQGRAVLIDSRTLVSYPYRNMARDREHFFGAQMDEWANKVYSLISNDMVGCHIGSLPRLSEQQSPKPASSSNHQQPHSQLTVRAKLIFKSKPLAMAQLLPYQESLVAFLYEIEKVTGGSYTEKDILVLHPAHIGLQPQPLDKYSIGETFLLNLDEVDLTPWNTIKTSDETDRIDLIPYIRTEDENRLPSHQS